MSDVHNRRTVQTPGKVGETASVPRHAQLAQALLNLQHAVGQCHDFVFFTDQAGVITRVNPAFEKLTGHAALDAVGMDLSCIIAGGPQSESYRRIWARIFAGEMFTGSVGIKQKGGIACEVELTITALHDSRGSIASLVGTGYEHAQPADHRDSALDSVLTDGTRRRLAHEFSNLLMIMGTHAELAFNSLPAEHTVRRNLQEITNAARRASELARVLRGETESLELTEFSRLNRAAEDAWIGQRGDVLIDSIELPSPPELHPHSHTLLIVDDEMMVREATAEFLSKTGYRVLSASSGEEALDELKLHPARVDLVITDVVLPQMSGAQLAGAVSSIHPDVKTLFISGYSESVVLHHQVAKPGVHFLSKPFPLHTLADKIEQILEQPQVMAAGASI